MIRSSVNAKLSVRNPQTVLRKHFPWFHGVADEHDGRRLPAPPLRRVFLHLPTSDIYVSAVSSVDVFVEKRRFYFTCLSDQEHMTTKSPRCATTPLLCIYMLLLERELLCVCESIPKCSHVCMYTFVIVM